MPLSLLCLLWSMTMKIGVRVYYPQMSFFCSFHNSSVCVFISQDICTNFFHVALLLFQLFAIKSETFQHFFKKISSNFLT